MSLQLLRLTYLRGRLERTWKRKVAAKEEEEGLERAYVSNKN